MSGVNDPSLFHIGHEGSHGDRIATFGLDPVRSQHFARDSAATLYQLTHARQAQLRTHVAAPHFDSLGNSKIHVRWKITP